MAWTIIKKQKNALASMLLYNLVIKILQPFLNAAARPRLDHLVATVDADSVVVFFSFMGGVPFIPAANRALG